MGLRFRKRIKVLPGLSLTISPRGIGTSIGVNGFRITHGASGRVTRTVGLPGTGISYVTTVPTHHKTNRERITQPRESEETQYAIPSPSPSPDPDSSGTSSTDSGHSPVVTGAAPSLLARGYERDFYDAIHDTNVETFSNLIAQHPETFAAAGLLGVVVAVHNEDYPKAEEFVEKLWNERSRIFTDSLFVKYLSHNHVEVGIADGVSSVLPLDETTLALLYVEILQIQDKLDKALDVVRTLPVTPVSMLSVADILVQKKSWSDVVSLTTGQTNTDDITCLLMIYRAMAFREQEYFDAAAETFKEALKSKSRTPELRHRALLERADSYLAQGKKALARKDLEKILADDPDYHGLKEALAQVKDSTEPAKTSETSEPAETSETI